MNITIKIEEPSPIELRAEWETAKAVADFLINSPQSPLRTRPAVQSKEEPQKRPQSPPLFPPAGERIKDYAARAFETLGKTRAKPDDLIPVMLSAGWQSKSNNPVEVVRSSLRDAKTLFKNMGDGSWKYLANGSGPAKKEVDSLSFEETSRIESGETDSAPVS